MLPPPQDPPLSVLLLVILEEDLRLLLCLSSRKDLLLSLPLCCHSEHTHPFSHSNLETPRPFSSRNPELPAFSDVVILNAVKDPCICHCPSYPPSRTRKHPPPSRQLANRLFCGPTDSLSTCLAIIAEAGHDTLMLTATQDGELAEWLKAAVC
jgi:hypothetical protein